MKRLLALALGMYLCVALCLDAKAAAEETTEKQPIFLLCPSRERYSAWSLSFIVDKKDPSKPQSLVLEELSQINGKDSGGYTGVLKAQADPATPRTQVATLDAKSFGSGSLRVDQNQALNVTCTSDGENFKLSVDLRISADERFVLGGSAASKRDLVVKYDKAAKKWKTYATVLEDKQGKNVIGGQPAQITGIGFPVSSVSIGRIIASFADGSGVIVFDK